MRPAVGIFSDRASAERGVARLSALGFPHDRLTFLTPGQEHDLARVPTTEGEAPGMGKATGAVVGGAVGAAAGMPLGAVVSSLFIPGAGPVIAIGLAAAAVLGSMGAAVGDKLETEMTEGVPKDEVFVYADALRQGRSVVIVLGDDETQAGAARIALAQAGAESLDAAREQWWVGLRSAERERYVATGRDFDADEPIFRLGFETALRMPALGRSYGEAQADLRALYPEIYDRQEFRRGYEAGVTYELNTRGLRRRRPAA